MIQFALTLLIFLAFIGCSTIETKSYVEVRDAVIEVSKISEANLNMSREFARDSFADRIAMDRKKDLSDVMLSDETRIKGDSAMLAIEDSRNSIKKFNAAMIEYFELLVALSGHEVATAVEFENLALKLNGSISQLAPKDSAPIVSTAAAAMFKQFVNSNREKELAEAISRNQRSVDGFAEIGVKLVEIFRINSRRFYNMRFSYLSELFRSSGGDIERRREAAVSALELNDRFLKSIEMLNGLEASYRLVPNAHKSLISEDSKKKLKVVLQQLRKAGEETAELYKKVKE